MSNREFEQIIKYEFKNKALLNKALTHSSYCREHGKLPMDSNERLEFLGDAFLDAIISVELYKALESVDEGKLTKTRALVVCERSLAQVGLKLGIGNFLDMGRGEVVSGGRKRDSIVADAVEAVIGAIFLDGGYDEAKSFVIREFSETLHNALEGKLFTDYKTQVQEILQKKGQKTKISYVTDKETGPDHNKTFFVHLVCNGKRLGDGVGKSKKEAEQNAAKATLEGGNI